MQGRNWYNLSPEDALRRADSGPLGLSPEEARRRLETYGPNELQELHRISPWRILGRQFLDVLIIVLLLAAAISAAVGYLQNTTEELVDAAVILAIVILSAVLGFLQEFRAERAIEALRELASPTAQVLREGERLSIPATTVVPGDVVLLEAGDRIPADLRLLEAVNLQTNEASLTGESTPVSKAIEALEGEVYVGDRRNTCFLGCTVERGRGRGLVVATGMETELGHIAGMVQEEPKEETPLQRRLRRLARQIGAGVLLAAIVVFAVGLLQGVGLVDMFLTAVALAVAAIPEGLPAVVVITLALGLQRMARRNALIKRLPAAETLGSATVICSDKTGTLTRGEMNVRRIWTPGGDYRVEGAGFDPEGRFLRDETEVDPEGEGGLRLLLKAAALCNDAVLSQEEGRWQVLGDTTEGALLVAAARGGLRKEELEEREPRVSEIGFDSDRKRMTTIHRGEGLVAYEKGAPEVVVQRCVRARRGEEEVPLDDALRETILATNQEMAGQALRVLGLAYREVPQELETYEEDAVETDLVFLGLVGMIDAPRVDATEAVAQAKRSGIRVVMITGDHKLTAVAIAREMGILEEGEEALDGEDLEAMDDEALAERAERAAVYARVSPHHKVRIVDALRRRGHVVAMTGDGVNDAPALKRADIGVAMGITGTDVAQEASDMVLTDDNFASIVRAVEQGRGIFDNIRKFVGYLLSANAGEVLVIFLATLIFIDPRFLPFLAPIQILWINLVTDGLPALALGVDPVARDVMDRPPRPPGESPLNREVVVAIVGVGLLVALAGLFAFQWTVAGQPTITDEVIARGRTVVFTLIVVFELLFVFSIRSLHEPLPRSRPLANPWLLVAVGASFLLQLAVLYLPPLQPLFKTVPLGMEGWLLIFLLSVLIIIVFEVGKVVRNRIRPPARVGGPAT